MTRTKSGYAPAGDVSTLKRAVVDAPSVDLPGFDLEVQGAPGASRRVTLDATTTPRFYVGTSQASDLRLDDPLVSRRHAALELMDSRLRVEDLDSTNGSWANGARFREVFLTGGEVLRFGDVVVHVARTPSSTLPLESATRFGRLLGASPEMRRIYPLCERLALADVPVVIEGETGTGKELLAECLHEMGPRASQPFVVLDGSACHAGAIDTMLYGCEAGFHPGTRAAMPGALEQANGGTLLLDGVDALDANAQAKLLRILDRRQVQRLGGAVPIDLDVRIIVTARRDLEHEIQAGRFRDDLYYRLAVARIHLPPLRQRRGDVALLLGHFWTSMKGQGPVPDDLVNAAEACSWPGNVRELANMVARRVAIGSLEQASATEPSSEAGDAGDGGDAVRGDVIERVIRADLAFAHAKRRVLDDFERRYIAAVLAKHGGNVSRAAASSGIARRYFYVVRSRSGS